MIRRTARYIPVLLPIILATPALANEPPACAPPPDPVYSLSYGSRYTDDSASRSEIDKDANAEVDEALKPIDDFLRDLTDTANTVFEDGTDKPAVADCVVSQIAAWAAVDAMSDLRSKTSKLTVGSRIAGFGLVMLQVLPHTSRAADVATIKGWLGGLMRAQMTFWEEDAPPGAKQGNLRAWAALGGSATAAILDDPVIRGWSTWSIAYVMCSANPDGSLPQEMRRGKYALHYQLHAIAPLVVSALLLKRQGIAIRDQCDHTLNRIVNFAITDLDNGAASQRISGEVQSLFDGTDDLEGFQLAWLEAWLKLNPDRTDGPLERLAQSYRPLKYSKLGGNQTLIWNATR